MNANHGRTFMFVALVMGAAAAVVGYYGLTSMAARSAGQRQRDTREVVVTATDLTYGVKLDRAMLRTVRYPKDAVPEGAYTSMDSVLGQTTKVFMGAREPVTAIKLSSRGGGLSMLVRKDMRAASLEVNQVSGVSGFVLPGDRVDVLVTVDPRVSSEEAMTRTVLQNIEVLAAGQKTEQQDNKPITVQSVTVLVTPEGAETLALALHEGRIHLVLRNPDDQGIAGVTSLSTNQMLGNPMTVVKNTAAPVARPARREAPKIQVAVARPTERPKIRIIRSASVTETPAVEDSTSQ